MTAEGAAGIAGKCALAVLLAAALWYRVDGLSRVPRFDADEAYEGVVLTKLLHGEPTTLRTTNSNLLNPFFLALQAPSNWAFRPRWWSFGRPPSYRECSRSSWRTSSALGCSTGRLRSSRRPCSPRCRPR
jgi:hypothetical protein